MTARRAKNGRQDRTIYFGSMPGLLERVEKEARAERRTRNAMVLLLLDEALLARKRKRGAAA